MNLLAPAIAMASVFLPRPDVYWAWDAPAVAPDYYEVQVVTNLAQWQMPVRGTFVYTGQSFVLSNGTTFPIYFADAPCRFGRVRSWKGICPSDWATVSTTNDSNQNL